MAPKTILITGCSTGGIGHGLALEFARKGLHVFATARSLSKMSDLENKANITLLPLDVISPSSIASAVAAVKDQTGGKLDYLVNNSGAGYAIPFLDADIAKSKAMFDVNVWGFVAVTQAFAPLVIAAQGTIVNISSITALLRTPYMALYSASKAAMDTASEVLRIEMQPLGVKVITAVTGAVRTHAFDNAQKHALPQDSVYRAAEKEIETRMNGEDVFTASTTEEYARRLVGDVLGGKSGHVYRGKFATAIRILGAVLPEFVADKVTSYGMGLEKVKASEVRSKVD